MFNLPITSLQNHIYGITQSWKKGKIGVLQTNKCTCLVCEENAINWAPLNTHTIEIQNLVEITQDIITPFKNGILN